MKESRKSVPNAKIAASILSADFAHLGDATQRAVDAGVDYIHFDVMDNHFVPNLSFGALICQALRHAGIQVPIDVHLMVTEPESFIEPFAKAGANLITFHPETVKDVSETIAKIHDAGLQAGLAFNPDKGITLSPEILRNIHLLLIMSVYPGFGGQKFMEESLIKIQTARQMLKAAESTAFLGVDGGIKSSNVGAAYQAGADFFVIGSGLFHASDYRSVVMDMQKQFIEE